ncbi:hypothetical protein DYU11_09890 [Fibrisoma montanum]|uniref:VWA domain-containing protein n=1 Tax=Fibrisoma montanum TaxID=2305895 RepID=A0A418MFL6_9BACT|nr:hypothetical protein [Fibrisoma montanum]RIV25590.1 hypothetical protein DYU11_09890 [Fibrisoma montanum]
MTTVFFPLIVLALLFGPLCAGAVPPGTTTRPVNYVVLLDLSDRLLTPDQARRDVALIQAVFNRFEQGVRTQFIINSRDRFRVVIAPQQGIRYRTEPFMDALYLDLSATGMAHKRRRLDSLRTELPKQLTRLYAQATAGKRTPRDFAGCDLWQYVNEQLPTDLDPAYDNRLVVLTDGYFDFEHNTHGVTAGNRATDSRVLDRLRRDPNWRTTLAQPNEGLIPVRKPLPNLTVCVAEVRPKYDTLQEIDLLTALWDKWLRDMHVRRWHVLPWASQSKSLAMLNQILTRL